MRNRVYGTPPETNPSTSTTVEPTKPLNFPRYIMEPIQNMAKVHLQRAG